MCVEGFYFLDLELKDFFFFIYICCEFKIYCSELFCVVGESKVFLLIKIYKDKIFFDNGLLINLMIYC